VGSVAPHAVVLDLDNESIETIFGKFPIVEETEARITFSRVGSGHDNFYGLLDRLTGSMSLARYDKERVAMHSKSPTYLLVLECSPSKRLF
jgi:hypothetical protein